MSVTGKRGVGVPVILMHDGEGTIVTVECKNGDTYRGFLDETEDNMNCILKDATRTDAKGNKTAVEHIFLRGSQIAFFVFPNMLKKAPMFKRVRDWKRNNSKRRPVQGKEPTRSPPSVAGVLYSDKRTEISAETGALGRF